MQAIKRQTRPGTLWPVARDEGNPAHIGSVAWQRKRRDQAHKRYLRTGRYIEYEPKKEVRALYRHFLTLEARRVATHNRNPEHELDPVLLLSLELYTALEYLTYARRVAFEAVIIGRVRRANLITHKWQWERATPVSVAQCAEMMGKTAKDVHNLLDRACETLAGRIYSPFED